MRIHCTSYTRLCLAAGLVLAAASSTTPRAAEPQELVLRVVWDESGANANGSWKAKYDSRFRPSAIWNGSSGGAIQVGGKWKLIGGGPSPKFLYELRGSLLALEVGEKLQYYLSEASDSGTEVSGTPPRSKPMTASLSRDGTYTFSGADGTYVEDDATYRKGAGIPKSSSFPAVGRAYHKAIDLVRTKDGVTIVLGAGAAALPHAGGPGFPDGDLALADGVWEDAYAQVKTFKLTNDELKRLSSVVKTNKGSASGDVDSSLSVTATLSFTADDGGDVEVAVEPEQGYDRWLPKGRLEDPETPGSNLLVRLDAHKKGDAAVPRKVKLEISLGQVSKNKGVCSNWPRKTAAVGEGLRFRKEDFPAGGPLVFVDATHVRSKEPVEKAELLVHAHDFGAYGTLTVKAKDEQERDAVIRVRGQDGKDLRIPLDENDNHIADAWELAELGALRGAAGDDDEDRPAGKPGTKGDGLGLYEEYRGFRVQGSHVRADPRRKDVFVCDHTAGQVAQAGIDLFESATKLKVWRMTFEELGNDRLVNRNGGGLGHVVDQHGILIETGPAGGDPQQVPIAASAAFGPPKQTLFVQLPAGRSYASGDGQADAAHELAHAVGVSHHGEDNLYAVDWEWRLEEGQWRLYEQALQQGKDGTWQPNTAFAAKPIEVLFEPASGGGRRPYQKSDGAPAGAATVGVDRYRLLMGGERSPFSGDQECLLRYADKQAYLAKGNARLRYIPDKAQWKMRTHLCTAKQGTGVNEPGHAPQSRYGPAPSGNCAAQLVVNDKFAE